MPLINFDLLMTEKFKWYTQVSFYPKICTAKLILSYYASLEEKELI